LYGQAAVLGIHPQQTVSTCSAAVAWVTIMALAFRAADHISAAAKAGDI